MKNKIILGIMAFALISCNKLEETETTSNESTLNQITLREDQIKSLKLVTDTLLKGEIPITFSAIGMIDVPPNDLVEISLPITARVVSMKELLPGKHLQKGEILAEFESYEFLDLQEKYLSIQAELEANKKEFERQKTLLKDQISSQKEFDAIEFKVKSNQSLLESLKLKLENLQVNFEQLNQRIIAKTIKIYSPFEGNIGEVNIVLGKTYNPSTSLVSIIKTNHLHAELKIYEQDFGSIELGNKVVIFDQNNNKYPAKIFLIGKNINPNDRTISVHSHFENKMDYDKIILGQQIKAEIYTQSKLHTIIPIEGIIQEGKEGIIFSIEGNRIFQNSVKILGQFNESIAIEPLKEIKGRIILNQASGINQIFNKE